ncbi:MAG: alpha/beta fold hydrolase, partial [Bdellovibrionales bacterium]|nr:alpha/beta fold hydrolase [Bdellovibrionales bacterium]
VNNLVLKVQILAIAFAAHFSGMAIEITMSSSVGELTQQDFLNRQAQKCMELVASTYKSRTSASPIHLNFYAADNKGETFQNRQALYNIGKKFSYRSFDMNGSQPVDWSLETNCRSISQLKPYYMLSAHESLFSDESSVILMTLVSNTHVSSDVLATGVGEYLSEKGVSQVVFEYPGYGGSLGPTDAQQVVRSSVAAIQFLKQQFPNKKIFLLGHSIGAGFAYETAARAGDLIDGVMTYGGIMSVYKQSEDQKGFGPKWLTKAYIWLASKKGEILDFENVLEKIVAKNPKLPFLILHGEADMSVPVRHSVDIKSSIRATVKSKLSIKLQKNFTVHTIPGAGHEEVHFPADKERFFQVWDQYFRFMATTYAN